MRSKASRPTMNVAQRLENPTAQKPAGKEVNVSDVVKMVVTFEEYSWPLF